MRINKMPKKDSYTLLDHTADIMYKVEAATIEGLFNQAGLAIGEITTNLKTIEEKVEREITAKGKKIDMLLFDFLDDLLFYKDAELTIFSRFDISIKKDGEEYILNCKAFGEPLDANKHDRKIDIKAITMHLFEVKQIADRWEATVLVDI